MKTSKEMQLCILDKMRENVENDFSLFDGVQCFEYGTWRDEEAGELLFEDLKYRVKPETITINGVDIPKPLDDSEIKSSSINYFMPCLNKFLFTAIDGHQGIMLGCKLLYLTESEAIEASRLLFGIEG